ncbi:hypothetical protein [Ligilactobacillus acidipiscis]|nr:hypothetical protein [Ligilactobacillus acidipiscis]
MFRTQINSNAPIVKGSGKMMVELPFIPHAGDNLMLGDSQALWQVVKVTYIIHDEFHPKRDFVDLVVEVVLSEDQK